MSKAPHPTDRAPPPGGRVRAAAAVLLTVVVGLLDLLTGPDIAFAPFYLIPVAVAAWYAGRFAGLAMAVFASLAWLLVEAVSGYTDALPVLLWNGFSRLCIFAALALVLDRLREEQLALERANRQLEQQNRDLDAFAGRVAHDLRNAMAPIALAASVLRSPSADPERIAALADRIEASSRKSMLVINALLALARAGQPLDASASTELLPAIGAALAELDDPVSRQGIDLSVRVEPGLRVRCDPGLLHVVLANLIGNAVKYVGCHPGPRAVVVSAAVAGQRIEIAVADTGPGIPLAEQSRIFEPFYRAKDAGAVGTGIGLATVERIMRSQGGSVAVESDGVSGATFRVRLPRAE